MVLFLAATCELSSFFRAPVLPEIRIIRPRPISPKPIEPLCLLQNNSLFEAVYFFICSTLQSSLRWGWWDTATAFDVGLKPGFSKLNWVWILPKLFFQFTWKDFVERLHGSNRVA